MADNPYITALTTGVKIAAEEIGEVEFQKVKLVHGLAGSTAPIAATIGVPGPTQLGLVVAVIPGASVVAQVAGTVTVQEGLSVSAQVSGTVTIAAVSAAPAWITGTVTAGAGTTVVSLTGSALVSGTVTVEGQINISAASSAPAWITGTVTAGAGTTVVSLTGSALVSGTISIMPTILTVNTAGTIAGASVTIQQGASITWAAGATVAIVPGVSVLASVNTLAAGFSVQALVTGPVSISAMPVVSMTGALVSVVSTVLGTVLASVVQPVTIAGGTLATTAVPAAGASGLVIYNADLDITTGTPAANATGQLVWLVNPTAVTVTIAGTGEMLGGTPFLAMVSATAAVGAGSTLLFTVWTGATLAGAAQTQYPVPNGKTLRIKYVACILQTSASVGRSVMLVVNAATASASLTSANLNTIGWPVALPMLTPSGIPALYSVAPISADIGANTTMGLFFTCATSGTIQAVVIQGMLI